MRIKTYPNGGYSQGGFTSPGGTMTGSLILSGNPTDSLHAAPKQYVDSVLSNFSAAKFTTGVIQVSRLPALSGDAVAASGTNNISLISTGVTTGVYTKVTVNAKGLITTASGLLESDVPVLSWTKITTGKPTTLAGYGITDALPLSGGLINGDLTLHADPTNAMHLATKQYVDAKMLSATGAVTGDIYLVNSNAIPSGYLRLNGADVSKTTYSALYAVVGDTFNTQATTTPGSGKPWRQQYAFNTTQSSDITGWSTGTSLPEAVSRSQAIVTKNRVYLLGGWGALGPLSTVYTAPINGDGTLGAWTIGTSLPGGLSHSQAIVTQNRVYLLGGFDDTSTLSTVYTAPINSDGTLGAWTTGASLPDVLDSSQAIVTQNRVYLLGGSNDESTLSTVYTAPINGDGTLGAWITGGSLPEAMSDFQAIVTQNRVYLLGGRDASYAYLSTVYTAPINGDGTLGAWSTGTSLPGPLSYSQAIVTQNRVYSLGGGSGGGVATVYTAPFSGGLNDYTPYYDGTPLPTDPSQFRLPDTTLTDPVGAVSVIKT